MRSRSVEVRWSSSVDSGRGRSVDAGGRGSGSRTRSGTTSSPEQGRRHRRQQHAGDGGDGGSKRRRKRQDGDGVEGRPRRRRSSSGTADARSDNGGASASGSASASLAAAADSRRASFSPRVLNPELLNSPPPSERALKGGRVMMISPNRGDLVVENETRLRANRLFQRFDTDGDGFLDVAELQPMLLQLGFDASAKKVTELHSKYDTDGNHLLDRHEFLELVLKEFVHKFIEIDLSRLQEAVGTDTEDETSPRGARGKRSVSFGAQHGASFDRPLEGVAGAAKPARDSWKRANEADALEEEMDFIIGADGKFKLVARSERERHAQERAARLQQHVLSGDERRDERSASAEDAAREHGTAPAHAKEKKSASFSPEVLTRGSERAETGTNASSFQAHPREEPSGAPAAPLQRSESRERSRERSRDRAKRSESIEAAWLAARRGNGGSSMFARVGRCWGTLGLWCFRMQRHWAFRNTVLGAVLMSAYFLATEYVAHVRLIALGGILTTSSTDFVAGTPNPFHPTPLVAICTIRWTGCSTSSSPSRWSSRW